MPLAPRESAVVPTKSQTSPSRYRFRTEILAPLSWRAYRESHVGQFRRSGGTSFLMVLGRVYLLQRVTGASRAPRPVTRYPLFCDLRPKQAGERWPHRKRAGREEGFSADNLQGPDFTLRQCRALFTGACACPRPVHLLFPLLALVVYVCKCWRPWSAACCRRKTTLQPVRTPTPTLTHAKTASLPGNTISNSTLTAYFLLLVLVRAGTGLRCALVPRQSSVTPRAFPPPACFHSYALERGVCTCTSHFLVAPLATDDITFPRGAACHR